MSNKYFNTFYSLHLLRADVEKAYAENNKLIIMDCIRRYDNIIKNAAEMDNMQKTHITRNFSRTALILKSFINFNYASAVGLVFSRNLYITFYLATQNGFIEPKTADGILAAIWIFYLENFLFVAENYKFPVCIVKKKTVIRCLADYLEKGTITAEKYNNLSERFKKILLR